MMKFFYLTPASAAAESGLAFAHSKRYNAFGGQLDAIVSSLVLFNISDPHSIENSLKFIFNLSFDV